MKKLLEVILKIIGFITVWIVLYVVFDKIPKSNSPEVWRLEAEIPPLIAVIIATLIFWFIEKRQLKIFVVKKPLRDILLGIVTGFLWVGIAFGILLATGTIKLESVNDVPNISIWILAAFLNATMQEILFRGYLYQLIKSNYNLISATIVTTFMFTGLHFGAIEAGIIPAMNVFTMSLFMIAVLEYTGSLVAPSIIHAIWNIVGCIIFGSVALASDYPHLYNATFTGSEILSGGEVKMEGSIVVLILNILLTCLFIFLNKKETKLV